MKISKRISFFNQRLRIQLIVNRALGAGEEGQSYIYSMAYNIYLLIQGINLPAGHSNGVLLAG